MSADQNPTPKAYVIERSLKADSKKVVSALPWQTEDIYVDMYYTSANSSGRLIQPPIDPILLKQLVFKNNVLLQCVEAMEVNIAGTGTEVRGRQDLWKEVDPNPKEAEYLHEFMNEPYPGMSWTTLKRTVRWELEATGNAYLEVLRTADGKLAFLRTLDSSLMRLLRLDKPVPVDITVKRWGKDVTMKHWVRERKYCMRVGTRLQYYRDYGSTRQVNRINGDWVEEGEALKADEVGTEVIHLTLHRDPVTPYGLPRWFNNTPSALGSRKAEEFNLGYFDAGGLPPALIFLKGGSMAAEVAETLRGYLSGKVSDKQRAVVIEMFSNAGSLDASSRVDVQVERFGWESTQDSMFRQYDKDAESHLLSAFRLPPLFLGKSNELNFASAYASYLIAEAQVFKPERDLEDERFNNILRKELGLTTVELRSLPMNVKDVAIQLKAIDLVSDRIDPANMVNTVNDVVGLDLKFDQPTYDFWKEYTDRKKRVSFSDSNTNNEANSQDAKKA